MFHHFCLHLCGQFSHMTQIKVVILCLFVFRRYHTLMSDKALFIVSKILHCFLLSFQATAGILLWNRQLPHPSEFTIHDQPM